MMASNSRDPDDPDAVIDISQSDADEQQTVAAGDAVEAGGAKPKEPAIGVRIAQAFNCATSTVYSHNYFRKNPDGESATCLTCEKFNEGLKEKNKRSVRKQSFSAAKGSTSGKIKINLNIFQEIKIFISKV